MGMRIMLAALLVTTGLASCGRPARRAPSADTARTVVVHLADDGDSIELHAGDRLSLSLPQPDAARRWWLARVPTGLLARLPRRAQTTFDFAARGAGRGRLVAWRLPTRLGQGCARPRLRCPIKSESGREVAPAGLSFSITVIVA
jgi:hypothetical protein